MSEIAQHLHAAVSARFGAVAGLLAGPLLLGAIAVNTLVSLDWLREIGWTLSGEYDLPKLLAVGPHAWVQAAALLAAGACVLVFAGSLRRELPARRSATVACLLIGGIGAALMLAAAPADLDESYLVADDPESWKGYVHSVGFLLAVVTSLTAPIATMIALRGVEGWRGLARISLLVPPLALGANFLPFGSSVVIWLAALLGWIGSLAYRLYRLS